MHTSKHTYGKKSITPKAKKLHPFVDLTAMVNLSFLLMMFFMLQNFMKKTYSMDLRLPQQYNDPYGWSTGGCGGEWKTFTILLGANNKVVTYMGMAEYPFDKPQAFQSGSKALRNNIIAVNNYVKEHVSNPKKEGLFVVIKPSATCVFENLVETMDEMHINKVRGFVVDDQLNKEEQKLLDK